MDMGNFTQLYWYAQLSIKNKDTGLVWNQSDWNMDELVGDNRPLRFLINLKSILSFGENT